MGFDHPVFTAPETDRPGVRCQACQGLIPQGDAYFRVWGTPFCRDCMENFREYA